MPTIAERFNNLFSGLKRAHGWYVVAADAVPNANGKVEGRRATATDSPVTLALWEEHLAGKKGLGIIPAREDGLLRFAAIDIDVYPIDIKALAADVARREMPLIVCRTKSGGAHLYFFTVEPLDAATVRDNMKAYAAILGYPGVEVFPKQDRIESDADTGNWINMPYYGGEFSLRYALTPEGVSMSIGEFLTKAESMHPTLTAPPESPFESDPADSYYGQDDALVPDEDPDDEPADVMPYETEHERPTEKVTFGGAPPCLITLSNRGFPASTRNNGLFNLGVYAKKVRPDGWRELIKVFNAKLMIPPLEDEEVNNILKSLNRKRYFYKCKDHPIAQVCEKKICLTREHGVGGGAAVGEAGIDFGDLSKVLTKPVMWLWDIDGQIIGFETADLMNQAQFQSRVIDELSIWPPTIKTSMWRGLIQSRMERCTEIVVPEDATVDGQVWEHLSRFCTSKVIGYSIDELLLGKPFTDPMAKLSYFVATDFLKHLSQNRFPSRMNERLLYVSLRDRGLQHHRAIIKGATLSYWSVPAFESQNEEHAVPKQDIEGAM